MSIEQTAGHMKLPFKIKPGAVIVLEGLDATGKSTQHEKMERSCMGMGHGKEPLFDPEPIFLHMPSAGTHIGQAIYDLTETVGRDLNPLARQFLHLASHAQSVATLIKPAIARGLPVVLDRWWWSTVAYGWYGGRLGKRSGFTRSEFVELCANTWLDVDADFIALFMHPHADDHHNTERVIEGYHWLHRTYPDKVVLIEPGNPGEQGEQLYAEMAERGIYWSA